MKQKTSLNILCGVLAMGTVGSAGFLTSGQVFAADDITISRPHRMSNTLSSRLYVGANLGYSRYTEIDDSSASYGLFGGYHINEILAVDIGWTNLGEASNSSTKADTTLFQLGMMGKIPLRTDLTLFGKIGLAMWDYDLTKPISDSDNSTDAFIGFGADYSINGQSAVRFGLDFYSLKPEFAPEKENISEFSIGILFKP